MWYFTERDSVPLEDVTAPVPSPPPLPLPRPGLPPALALLLLWRSTPGSSPFPALLVPPPRPGPPPAACRPRGRPPPCRRHPAPPRLRFPPREAHLQFHQLPRQSRQFHLQAAPPASLPRPSKYFSDVLSGFAYGRNHLQAYLDTKPKLRRYILNR